MPLPGEKRELEKATAEVDALLSLSEPSPPATSTEKEEQDDPPTQSKRGEYREERFDGVYGSTPIRTFDLDQIFEGAIGSPGAVAEVLTR
ncbi:hypothetical protein GCM10023199_44340 [Actinomycetospora chibensis]